MKSLWREADAKRMVAKYARQGVNKDVALRVYTSRLLGNDAKLVLHGGGNTSVKTTMKDILGVRRDVLCVKGSGWDLGDIEPRGLPALRLADLLELRRLKKLSDEDMVSFQRGCLLDATSPNPSVETLLHAFLPHKFVDHTHSTAVLAITDQPNGAELSAEVFGDRAALVPYVMPGFALALKAAEVAEANPDVEGLILLKHGIFSFGDTAKEAYERMTSLVSLAEQRLKKGRRKVFSSAALPKKIAAAAEVAPILRGIVATARDDADPARMVLDFRTNAAIRNYVDGKDVAAYGQRGVVTPDHNIRIKNWPLIVPAPEAGNLEQFTKDAAKAQAKFAARCDKYFARHDGKRDAAKTALDRQPRVILAPGLGLFGVGKSMGEAGIAADLAENTVEVITDAEAIGRFQPLSEANLFDMEYWSLEQAKLGKGAEKPLARRVALITGGGGGLALRRPDRQRLADGGADDAALRAELSLRSFQHRLARHGSVTLAQPGARRRYPDCAGRGRRYPPVQIETRSRHRQIARRGAKSGRRRRHGNGRDEFNSLPRLRRREGRRHDKAHRNAH